MGIQQGKPVNQDDLVEIAERMSQELQEFIDAADEAGSPLEGTKALLDEWNEAFARFNSQTWQGALLELPSDEEQLSFIDEL